jgi:hypothetical protein
VRARISTTSGARYSKAKPTGAHVASGRRSWTPLADVTKATRMKKPGQLKYASIRGST